MGRGRLPYTRHDQASKHREEPRVNAPMNSDAMTLPRERTYHRARMPQAGEVIAQRYTLEDTLGMGTYGQVFSAWDAVRSHRVALKILRDISPAALLRFKHEFRALNDLRHPNLVRIFKLGRDGHIWFIAMELVRGVPFTQQNSDERARTQHPLHSEKTTGLALRDNAQTPLSTDHVLTLDDPIVPRFDLYTLRDRLLQLCQGILALHAINIVHCDLKPSNILVTPQGRVIILDFGVSQNVSPLGAHQHDDGTYAGTRAYMAPEVRHSKKTTAAFDWYSVGIMLAELLTGYHASILSGTPSAQLFAFLERGKEQCPTYQNLFTLCISLLHPEPAQRADHRAILAACDAQSIKNTTFQAHSAFVGRHEELAQLHQIYRNFLQGNADTILLEGEHGSGKSALCRQFLQDVTLSKSPAYILLARCKSDELIGYRAFDEVVDGLAAVLRAIPKHERQSLLEFCTPALYALFPALRSIAPAQADTQDTLLESHSPEDALYALHELLGHVARKRRIIIWVDDIHNADRDSLRWIARIFGPGVRPHLLLLLTQSPRDRLSDEPVDIHTLGYAVPRITLQPFDEETARVAVHQWLSPSMIANHALVDEIIALGHGRPDALRSLCRYADHMQRLPRNATLTQLIESRIQLLSQLEYQLLCIVALAMGPIDIRMIMQLCDAQPLDIDQALYWLGRKMLLRTATTMEDEQYEIWDQSVEHAIRTLMPADAQRALHKRFAHIGERLGNMPPATLIGHLMRAQQTQRAESYAQQHAAASEQAGAWESAAQLYTLLLRIHQRQKKIPPPALLLRAINCQLRTGRLADAAHLMADLAERLPREEACALHLRAAETFTLCGMIDEGNAHAARARKLTGKTYLFKPMGPQMLRVAALRTKLELRLRTLDLSKLTNAPLEPTHEALLGTYRVSGIEVSLTDALRAFEFSMRELDLALDLNRKLPIARALASFCSLSAGGGLAQQQRAYQWLELAQILAQSDDDRVTQEWINICRCTVDYQMGHYRAMWERLEQSHQWLTKHASHQSFIVSYLDVYRLLIATLRGEIPRLRNVYYGQIADARIRNNQNAETSITLTGFLTWFIDDAPSAAQNVLERLEHAKPAAADNYQLYHFFYARSRIDICLYEQRTYEYATQLRAFRRFENTLLCRSVEAIRDETRFTLGRLTLAQAKHRQRIGNQPKRDLLRWGTQLSTSHVPLAQGWGNHLLAGLAYLQGNPTRASSLLRRAIDAHQQHELHFFEELSRAAGQHANLLPCSGDPYHTLRTMGVARPERLVQSYHPYI